MLPNQFNQLGEGFLDIFQHLAGGFLLPDHLSGRRRSNRRAGLGLVILKKLTRPFNREPFLVQQPFDLPDGIDIIFGIDPVTGAILRRREIGKFSFPVTQYIRLQAGDFTDLADGVIQLFDVQYQSRPFWAYNLKYYFSVTRDLC